MHDWDYTPTIKEQTTSYFLHGLRTLWKLTATQHKRIAVAVLVLLVVESINLSIPLLFKQLVDVLPQIVESGITKALIFTVVLMFVLRVMMLLLRRFVQEPIFLRAIIALENYWPRMAQEKLLALSVGYHERENTGRKISKVNKGVERLVGMLADLFWNLMPALFYLLLNIPILIYLDWRIGLLFVLPLIPFIYVNLRTYQIFYPMWLAWEKKKEESVGMFCQSIINVRTVQAFVREEPETQSHGALREDMRELDVDVSLRIQRYFFVMETILGVCFLTTIISGLYFVYRGWSTVGTVAYVFITGNAALHSLWGMVHVYTRMLRHLVSAERMQALLEENIDVANDAPGTIPETRAGVLAFEHVSHIYPGKRAEAVEGINIEIHPDEMVAFVGRSGSGKSTMASLLARVLDPTSGAITLDGIDVREVDRDWYRRRFAVVPQDVEIYEGTIRHNITLGYEDAKDAWVEKAVEAACLDEIVTDTNRFPDGLMTTVGERGVRLSGGERQRVGIARAYVSLLAGAQILILDEATSSLDSQSERVVQEFLQKLRCARDITIVAIAHRLSTIHTADMIYVLEDGRIVEKGDHAALLRRNGIYKRLVRLQDIHEVRA